MIVLDRLSLSGSLHGYEENEDGFIDVPKEEYCYLTDLVSAILIGDDGLFETELAATHDVNKVDATGCTPLHYASYIGNTQYIEQLLEHGALPDVKDANRISPLHRAVEKDNYEAVDRLLSSGANQWSTCKLQQTPLHVAASHNAIASARLLLQLSPEHINKTDKQGSPALHHASYYNNEDFVQLLLDFKADVAVKDKEGRTAAHWAAIGGHEQVLSLLNESGADLSARDKRGRTPLHYSAFTGKTAAIDCLLRRTNQPIDARDNDGFTPLHYATHTGNIRAIKILLENGGSIECESVDGMNIAHIASAHTESSHALDFFLTLITNPKYSESMKIVLEGKRRGGFTPLHLACDQGRISRVDALVKVGVDPHAKAEGDIMPLHVSARAGHQLVVKHLLKHHNVDANVQLRDGLTALHLSAYHSFFSSVKTLIELGADVSIVDGKKRTPLHLAAVSTNEHNEYCVEALLDGGAEVSPKDVYGFTPLHYAAAKGNAHVVEKLLRADADTEAVDNHKRTALHYAVLNKHCSKVVQALCRSNERLIQKKDDQGFYPIHYAASKGNSNLVQFLFDGMGGYEGHSSGTPFHLTPLHVAAAYDRLSVVKVLLAAQTKQAEAVEQGYRNHSLTERIGLETDARTRIPLHHAMQHGFLECAKALMKQRSSWKKQLNWEDKHAVTPFHLAAANRHSHCIQWAMSMNEVSWNKTDQKKRTCGMLAITSRLDSVSLNAILDKTCLTQKDNAGRGYLHRAVFVSNRTLMKRLLTECHVNDSDKFGVTPLHVAAAVGDRDIVSILVKAGAKLTLTDDEGRLAADWAAASGQLETLEELAPSTSSGTIDESSSYLDDSRQSGGDADDSTATATSIDSEEGKREVISSPSPPIITPSSILMASYRGHLSCIAHLLSLSSSLLHVVDHEGRTPLHLSSMEARFDCVELLIDKGASIEVTDYLGRTPLMMAAMKPRAITVVEHLLEHGADISKADVDGNTVFHLLCKEKNEDAAKLLVNQLKEFTDKTERDAIANKQNNLGETALHLITKHGLYSYLLDFVPYAAASIWIRDNNDRFPLTCGVEDGDIADCMNTLLNLHIESVGGESDKRLSTSSRKNSQSTQDSEFY